MAVQVSRRSLLLDGAAAVGFALLPQVTLLRTGAAVPSSAVVWLLSVAAAAPLTVRRIWPVPVFAVVLAVACVAVPFGLGPAFSWRPPMRCTRSPSCNHGGEACRRRS